MDSRYLGGSSGTLDGPFAAKYLLQSASLGDYVNFLNSEIDCQSAFETRGVGGNALDVKDNSRVNNNVNSNLDEKEGSADPLYECLIESITLGYTAIASSLLDLGVNPNGLPNRGRLGKVTDRKQQRALFKSNPLHLVCLRGNPYLVQKLLSKGKSVFFSRYHEIVWTLFSHCNCFVLLIP